MGTRRSDLILEAAALADLGERDGLFSRRQVQEGIEVAEVEVRSSGAAARLGKPVGRYITLELGPVLRREEGAFGRTVGVLAGQIRRLVPREGTVLVACLGNRRVTPDALGALVGQRLLATRHLVGTMPELFGHLRRVCAVEPGVLGERGMESGELVCAAVERVKPGCVLAVDALAAGSMERLCATAQLSDGGIAPGSGVGNRRWALSEENLGVPVVALGVPTVVDAWTLTRDVLEQAGQRDLPPEGLAGAEELFVTPRDIDEKVSLCAKVLAYAINLALQEGMTREELELLVE